MFGSHIFSTFLFAFELKKEIAGILDNGELKKGRRFDGTNFIVSSPKLLRDMGRVNVILKAGLHSKEIKSGILENINKDVIFW